MVQNEVYLCYKDWHFQPVFLEQLPYWQYELILKKVNEINKEEERNKKENEKYNSKSISSEANKWTKNINKSSNSYKMPSAPKMPKI